MQWRIESFALELLARRTCLVSAPLASRTGRSQHHASGVLVRARHCSETAAEGHGAIGPIIEKSDVIHKTGSA